MGKDIKTTRAHRGLFKVVCDKALPSLEELERLMPPVDRDPSDLDADDQPRGRGRLGAVAVSGGEAVRVVEQQAQQARALQDRRRHRRGAVLHHRRVVLPALLAAAHPQVEVHDVAFGA